MTRRNRIMISLAGLALMLMIGSCSDDDSPSGPVNANQLIAINGFRYRGTMTLGTFDRPVQFALTDAGGDHIANQQIQVDLLEGDGTIPESIVAGSNGIATLPFTFSGSLPYATVRLTVPEIDTIEVEFRADAILPGPNGQVSYVRFNDRYSDVVAWLGEPRSEDAYPNIPDVRSIYANYENSYGVVVMLYDLDKDNTFYDTSSVYGVIVNTIYDGTTVPPNPVGVGSSLADARIRFGLPDSAFIFEDIPDTMLFKFNYWGLGAWAHVGDGDTTFTEMHFSEYVIRPAEIIALDGLYSKGASWNSLQVDSFAVEDADNNRLGGIVIDTHLVVGDGRFQTIDNMRTDPASKIARYGYQFNGSLGHAVIRLTFPEVEALDISLRANVIVPGSQGQYILFDETYVDVQNWNGTASATAGDGLLGTLYTYASFASYAGVTVIFADPANTNALTNASEVYGVSVVSPYAGTTKPGIKIGSSYNQVTAAYLSPTAETVIGDTLRLTYDALPGQFDLLLNPTDTTVVRITTWEAP